MKAISKTIKIKGETELDAEYNGTSLLDKHTRETIVENIDDDVQYESFLSNFSIIGYEDPKIGEKYLCIKDCCDTFEGLKFYCSGKVYQSEKNSCITDEQGDESHYWCDGEHALFFEKLEENTTEPMVNDNEREDKVNHPSHYTWLKDMCGIEVIDITRHLDFNMGNAIKYILRSGRKSENGYSNKDKAIEDLKKAIFYINDEINNVLTDYSHH